MEYMSPAPMPLRRLGGLHVAQLVGVQVAEGSHASISPSLVLRSRTKRASARCPVSLQQLCQVAACSGKLVLAGRSRWSRPVGGWPSARRRRRPRLGVPCAV